jgi:hypothetical protein
MGALGPGAMKRIGRRRTRGLLDIADTNGQLRSLVRDQAAKDLGPLDGIGIPYFQRMVRDIAEYVQWTAH